MDERVGYLRIGELARRTGVSRELLRAWEHRYGLLRPARSPGGYRLYTGADEGRIRRMRVLLAEGLSAAEAARLVLEETERIGATPVEARGPVLGDLAERLERSLDSFDNDAAQATIDALLASFSTETVLRDVFLPYLRHLGDRWESGEATVAQEHFASGVLRGRLLGLARDWGRGSGPAAILACVPGEQHEFGLLMFGIVLGRLRWRVAYLGADTPLESVADATRSLDPAILVLSSVRPDLFLDNAEDIRRLTEVAPVAIAAAGATPHVSDRLGVRRLPGDPVTEARQMADGAA